METNIQNLIQELILLGEDEAELKIWERIFPTLTTDEQKAIIDSFKKEIDELKKLN